MSSDAILGAPNTCRFDDPQRFSMFPVVDLQARTCSVPFSCFGGHSSGGGKLTVMARSNAEAMQTLDFLGGGILGSGFGQSYLGQVMMPIRNGYYAELERVSAEIARRRAELGARLNDPVVKRGFVDGARGRRLSVARLYRMPMGPGAMLGGEIRDIRQYGWGGRSMSNLEARQFARRGLVGDPALNAILNSVDTPNPAATASAARAARVLRGGGAILIVGGAALTGYEIYRARPEDRPFVIRRAAVTTGASTAASVLAVGLAVMLGATGVGLIAVGIIAGIGASYGTERIFFAENEREVHALQRTGVVDGRALTQIGHR